MQISEVSTKSRSWEGTRIILRKISYATFQPAALPSVVRVALHRPKPYSATQISEMPTKSAKWFAVIGCPGRKRPHF